MLTRLRNSPLLPAALALLLRLPFFSWPLISDEASYAYDVYWWVRGYPLYVNLLGVERPQGLFVAYWVPVVLWGGATWAIRLWGALWIAATTVAVYACARKLMGDEYGPIAALLYALYSSAPSIQGFTANAETFMILPLTLSALALLHGRWFWAGLTAGLAISCKASGASTLLLAAAWWIYVRPGWKAGLRLAAGAGLVLAALVAHGVWSAGWSSYLYNMVLIRANGFYQPRGSPIVAFLLGCVATASAWLPLIVLLAMRPPAPTRSRWFLLLWLASCVAGMAVSGHWFWHYWIQIMPPLCIASCVTLAALKLRPRLLPRAVILCALAVPVLSIAQLVPLGPVAGSLSLLHRTGYVIAAPVSRHILENTQPEDTVYVAWEAAEVYYLSRRRAAVPYLFYAYVVSLPGAYDEIVASIASRTPTYVLALDRPITSIDPEGRFEAALQANYVPERSFPPAVLYRRRSLP